jgi:AcrR family transcriptional regulator
MKGAARERLLESILIELAERGYDDLQLDSVLKDAGVSEAEFATSYGELDRCLFAAYEQLSERLAKSARAGCASEHEWPRQICRGLEALLHELAAAPALARVLTRTFPAIGPSAYARYIAFLEAFIPHFAEGREYSGVGEELPGSVEMLAIGAGETIVLEEIEAGHSERLPEMTAAILFSLLVPFLGPERAAEEMRGAVAIG